MSARERTHVSYGPVERFYDEDRHTTRLVKRRYETWVVDGKKFGRWDYVPVSARAPLSGGESQ